QTRLKTGAQQKIFRMIPGMEHADFLRFGSIHRNTYLNAPAALSPSLSAKDQPLLLFAGQLTGVEGYTESAATGMMAGINLARLLAGEERSEERRVGKECRWRWATKPITKHTRASANVNRHKTTARM